MNTWKNLKKELLKDKDVAKEYKRLTPRYAIISQLIAMRLKKGITQKELAEQLGTKQSAIARFEAGNVNPTIGFLEKLAETLDCSLRISLAS